MTRSGLLRSIGCALTLAFAASACLAQPAQAVDSTYKPSVGQKGKDVVWVPSPQVLVDRMLDIAQSTPKDYVIDLGSGDGRTVITAAKRGIRALGIEYNPDLVELSRRNAKEAGVADRAQFVQGDIFKTDFSQATVLTLFLLPELNIKLRPTILEMKPGTRVLSNSFTMGDWEADHSVALDTSHGCENSWCTALLWIVPARVAGTHRTKHGELTLRQTFQKVSGTLESGGRIVPVEGKVMGEEIVLTTGARELRGRMNGKQLELL